MFSGLKTMWRLNAASLTVRNLLELHGCPFAKDISCRWVAEVNAQKPDLFNGRFGQRPHKISVAAVALAQGFTPEYDYAEGYAQGAIGTLLTEVAVNGWRYPFNGIDHTLLQLADDLYLARLSGSAAVAA
jgi:hypothetical protein